MVEMNDFENALDSAIEKSEKLTDKEIADNISKICKLKKKEILKKFPKREDLIRLRKLVIILNADQNQEEKNKKIYKNFNDLSGLILKILTDELVKG